jgi:hypothetical protein
MKHLSHAPRRLLALAIFALPLAALAMPLAAQAAVPSALENPPPGATVSGIGLITGWVCSARRIEASIDGGTPMVAGYGTTRPDTATVCGGNTDSGYGITYNWNRLAPGQHTIRMTADGVEFANIAFNVVDLGAEFLGDRAQTGLVNDFPVPGRSAVLGWQASSQSFVIRSVRDAPALQGRWNGADLERRSACRAPQNEGNHGTYSEYQLSIDEHDFNMTETAVTGLSCTYLGKVSRDPLLRIAGSYSCSDGKTGTFNTTGVMVSDREMSIQMAAKLSGSETCTIDKTLGGSRY